jgi:predicted permease
MSAGIRRPPRLAEWLLARRVRPDERAMVLGDLDEQFREQVGATGALGGALWYWREAARLVWGFWWWTPRPAWSRGTVMAMDDVRYAVRRLRHRPMAAAVSVATLACAIGAAAATWSLISAVLLNPLQVRDPDRLVRIDYRHDTSRGPRLSPSHAYPSYRILREAAPMPLAASGSIGSRVPLIVEGVGETRERGILFATCDFLDVLGLQPSLGRFITSDEDQRGAPLVAVLSERFWRRELQADPAVIGREIRVLDQPVRIVGVGPKGFRGLEVRGAPDLFMPLHSIERVNEYDGLYSDRPPAHWVKPIGRLPDEVTLAQMEERLNGMQLDPTGEKTFVLTDLRTASLPETSRADVRRFSQLLGSTVALLLGIGSLTVGMLLLLRTEARSGELAMCLALGASRTRLALGIALEGLLLAAAGAVLALPVSTMLFAGLQAFELPGSIRIARLDLALDGRVLAGVAGAAVLCVLLMAVVASLFGVRRGPGGALRVHAGATPRLTRRRPKSALVTAQVAVTLVLVTGAALFASSVARALSLNPGVDTSRLVSVDLDLENFGYDTARARSFVDDLRERLIRHPAIASVGISYGARGGNVTVDGTALDPPASVHYGAIDPHHADTIGVRILAGRNLTADDVVGGAPVALVSEGLAKRIAGDDSPLGLRIQEGWEPLADPAEIVGVVQSIRGVGSPSPLAMYRAAAQQQLPALPPRSGLSVGRRLTFRAADDASEAIGAVAATIRDMDPAIRLDPMMTFEDQTLDQMTTQRFGMTVMGALGAIALLLSVLGTYVLAESTAAQRRREFGIRAALGATGRHIRVLLLSDTLRLIGAGLLTGFALSWLGAGLIRGFLFEVEPFDPLVTGGVAAAIAAMAVAVSLRPTLSASRVDLARVLRED